MRRTILTLLALVMLSGCASTLQNVYDEQARRECERNNRGTERVMCPR